VDADFAGLFGVEDGQDPVSVKSRTGYVIFFSEVPLLWVSKLQTLIALSTMEAEYVALSQSMRDLIPIRETLKETMRIVFDKEHNPECATYSKEFKEVESNEIPPSTVYEDNAVCIKHAMMPKLSPRVCIVRPGALHMRYQAACSLQGTSAYRKLWHIPTVRRTDHRHDLLPRV
jgi:hypothetical protein